MWEYTDEVMKHFRQPKNVGQLKDADGVGQVGSIACGDALKLMFKLDDQGKISEVKFQTFGCASAIASSSALTEIIKGLTLEEAEKVSNQDIVDYLGGLPDQKMHCSVLGREALEAAIANYREGKGEKTPSKDLEARVVCSCFGVTENEITRVIQENDLKEVADITNYTKAGGGCGGCLGDLKTILEKTLRAEKKKEKKVDKKLSNIEKIKLVQETIEREVRPALQKDGGDLELIDVSGNNVIVSLRGNCANCRVANFTLKDVVEAKLREFVDKDIVVVEE